MKKKYGIQQDQLDETNIDTVLESKTRIGRRKSKRKLHNEALEKEGLKEMILEQKQLDSKLQAMDDEEVLEYQRERSKISEMFRDEEVEYFPVIIKAS
jgi:hypothetical protein